MCLDLLEPINEKPISFEPINADPINQDTINSDSINADQVNQKPMSFDTVNADPVNQKPMSFDTVNAEQVKQKPMSFDTVNAEQVNQSIQKENQIDGIPEIGVKESDAEKLNAVPLQRTVSSEILEQVKVQPAPMKFENMKNYESIRSDIYKNRKLSESPKSKEDYKSLYKNPYEKKPVADPAAGLSEKERRKLKSRQKKHYHKAEQRDITSATGDTLVYEKAVLKSRASLDHDKDKIKAQAQQYASGDALSALFGGVQLNEKYKNEDDPPYDIKDLMKRMELTKNVLALYQTGTNADGTPFTLEKKAEHAALRIVSEKMQDALTYILESNGVKLDGKTRDDGVEDENIDKKRLKAIATFNKLGNDVMLVKAQQTRLLLEQSPEYKNRDDYKAHKSARERRYRDGIEGQKKNMQPEAAELLEKLPAEFADSQYAADYAKRLQLANQKPQEYNQNKKVLDQLFSQFADNCRFLSEAKKNASDTSFLAHNAVEDKTLLKKIERSFTDDNEEYKLRRQNIQCFKQEIDALLGVENVPIDYHIMVAQEYNVTTKELENYRAPNVELTNDLYQDFLNEKPVKGQEADHIGRHIRRLVNRAGTFQDQCANVHPGYKIGMRTDYMSYLCPLYDVNENGVPLSEKDSANKKECVRIVDDLYSNDHAKILPYATSMMKELVSTKFSMDELSVENYPHNIDKIFSVAMQITTAENLLKAYPWLKDEVDPELFELYDKEVGAKLSMYSQVAGDVSSLYYGITFSTGQKANVMDKTQSDELKGFLEEYTKEAKDNLPEVQAKIANCSPGLLLPDKPKEGMEAEFISDYNKYEDQRQDTLTHKFPVEELPNNMDERQFSMMLPSVQFNASGEPRTPLDVQKQEEAQQIFNAYKNNDHDKMYQHLYGFSKDLLSINIAPEDVMPENFCKNIKTLKDFTVKVTAFSDNVVKHNPWFLEELAKTNPDMLAQLNALTAVEMDFIHLYTNSMLTHGCSVMGRAVPVEKRENDLGLLRQIFSEKYSQSMENFKNYCSNKKNVSA